MPKELTHWVLAGKALHRLPAGSRLKALLSEQRALYLAGAVLPDTLLHLFHGPWSRQALHLADRFHDTDGNSFLPLIEAERHVPGGLPDQILAGMLGVISHIQADCILHPFVYARCGIDDLSRHYRLETDIDCYLVHRGEIAAGQRLTDLVSREAGEQLVQLLAVLFDPAATLPRQALEQALSLHCRLQGMYGSTVWKLVACCLAFLPVRFFRRNRQLFYPLTGAAVRGAACAVPQPWQHPVTGQERHDTLDDLLAQAVTAMVACFERIERTGSLAAALTEFPGGNLLTGTVGVRLADAAFLPAGAV